MELEGLVIRSKLKEVLDLILDQEDSDTVDGITHMAIGAAYHDVVGCWYFE